LLHIYALKIYRTVVVYVCLKTATIETKRFEKSYVKTFIKILAVETLDRYTKSFTPVCAAPVAARTAAYLPLSLSLPLGLYALTQRATSGQGTALSLSVALEAPCEYFDLKGFHSYACNQSTYLVM